MSLFAIVIVSLAVSAFARPSFHRGHQYSAFRFTNSTEPVVVATHTVTVAGVAASTVTSSPDIALHERPLPGMAGMRMMSKIVDVKRGPVLGRRHYTNDTVARNAESAGEVYLTGSISMYSFATATGTVGAPKITGFVEKKAVASDFLVGSWPNPEIR